MHMCRHRFAFTIVELLVVMALIAVLMSLLLPVVARARQSADSVKCQAQLRIIGQALKIYETQNKGWFYPVVNHPETGKPQGRGNWQPPNERWPMYVFDRRSAPNPPPFDPNAYRRNYDPVHFPVTPFSPPVIRCPTDPDPVEAHTYVLNGYAAQRFIKSGSSNWGARSSSETVLAGEKYSECRDYFLEDEKTIYKVLDPYRHGPRLFSNYLYFDGHVSAIGPEAAKQAINPWESS